MGDGGDGDDIAADVPGMMTCDTGSATVFTLSFGSAFSLVAFGAAVAVLVVTFLADVFRTVVFEGSTAKYFDFRPALMPSFVDFVFKTSVASLAFVLRPLTFAGASVDCAAGFFLAFGLRAGDSSASSPSLSGISHISAMSVAGFVCFALSNAFFEISLSTADGDGSGDEERRA